LSTPLTRLCI